MIGLPRSVAKAIVGGSHAMTWISSVIVMGITAYFINKYPHDRSTIYELVISVLTVAFWLPSFIVPFMGSYRRWYLPLNFIFSYLWLTAFVFAALDYNHHSCFANAPRFGRCALKKANESFIFLSFIFMVFAIVGDYFSRRDEDATVNAGYEKNVRQSAETGQTASTTPA